MTITSLASFKKEIHLGGDCYAVMEYLREMCSNVYKFAQQSEIASHFQSKRLCNDLDKTSQAADVQATTKDHWQHVLQM